MVHARALGFVLSATIVLGACEGTIGGTTGGGEGPSSNAPPGGGGLNVNNGPGAFGDGVTVHLVKLLDGQGVVSFGVPVPNGLNLVDVSTVRVTLSGALLNASVKEVLATHDSTGTRTGVRSFVVQFPIADMPGKEADVSVIWRVQEGASPSSSLTEFGADGVSWPSPETITTSTRTISSAGGTNKLVESAPSQKTLFTAREPRVLATYPDGFLAQTGILGQQVTVADAAKPARAGLTFLSNAVANFTQSATYSESYALNPDPESVVDPVANYEGWLYDRCATYLTAYAHTNQASTLRAALRSCSYYASKITLSGTNRGIFTGKASPDSKYSHLRGLYAYYALTGDEVALAAGTAIADLWLNDATFVVPYAAGHIRAKDKLWTERLLGTSLEGRASGVHHARVDRVPDRRGPGGLRRPRAHLAGPPPKNRASSPGESDPGPVRRLPDSSGHPARRRALGGDLPVRDARVPRLGDH
jgi:hypothetical protein